MSRHDFGIIPYQFKVFILIVIVTTFRIMYDLVKILMGHIDPEYTSSAEKIIGKYAKIEDLNIWVRIVAF